MRIAVLTESDKAVKFLARRLFDLKQENPETLNEVEDHLLRENPFLQKEKLPSTGTLVIVPTVPNVKLSDESETSDVEVSLQEAVQFTITNLRTAMKEAIDKEKADLEQLKKSVVSQELREVLKKNEEAGARLKEMINADSDHVKNVTGLLSTHTVALDNLAKTLAKRVNPEQR